MGSGCTGPLWGCARKGLGAHVLFLAGIGLPLSAAAAPALGPSVLSVSGVTRTGKVTVTDLLKGERDALRQILAQRDELRRVRLGRRVAQGELLRLESVHLEVRRRRGGLVKTREKREAQARRRAAALARLVRKSSRWPLLDPRQGRVVVDGRRAMLRVVGRDLRELGKLKAEEVRLSRALDDVVLRRREAVAVLKDLDRRKDEIQARVARSRQELAELRHRRRKHRGQASEWNAEAYEIERNIVVLHMQVNREVLSFAAQRGKLVRPVPGMILTWFGDRRAPGSRATEESRGVEISALSSWKVRAPADGTVRFLGQVPTYGNVLVMEHGEGYVSVLGHLGAPLVKVGEQVKVGSSVAALPPGRDSGPIKVYFELRRSGRAVDPVPWLHGGMAELRRRGPDDRRAPPVQRQDAVVERARSGLGAAATSFRD